MQCTVVWAESLVDRVLEQMHSAWSAGLSFGNRDQWLTVQGVARGIKTCAEDVEQILDGLVAKGILEALDFSGINKYRLTRLGRRHLREKKENG